MTGSCVHGNDPSGFIKGEEFTGQLSDCQIIKEDNALCNLSVSLWEVSSKRSGINLILF
jgi:hypothetical protein